MTSLKRKFESRGLFQERDTKERSSLIKIKKVFKNYGYMNSLIIEPFSSGDESDSDNFKEASVKDVVNQMVDFNTIMTVKMAEDFPREAKPGLIFTNLDEWMNSQYMRQFLEEIPVLIKEKINPEIESINTFKYKKHYFSIVKFKNFTDAEIIFNYFNHIYKKKENLSKNTKGESIGVYFTYDLLELTLSNWYAVILRNLPVNCSNEEVKSFCEGKVSNVLYCLNPQKIKNSSCSVIVLRDLDDAEKLCSLLNKKEQGKDKRIKAHIHPKSCKIRRNPEKSHFSKMLSKKESIVFPKIMNTSASMIFKSLSIPKLYYELYEKKVKTPNKINDNIISKEKKYEDKKESEINLKSSIENKSKSSFNSTGTKTKNNLFSSSLLSMIINTNPKIDKEDIKIDPNEEIPKIENMSENLEKPDKKESNTNNNIENIITTSTSDETISNNKVTSPNNTTIKESISVESKINNATVNTSSTKNLLSKIGGLLESIAKQPKTENLNSSINTANELVNNSNKNSDNLNLVEIESQINPELTEQEKVFYTYDFKDKEYYENLKQQKQNKKEEEPRFQSVNRRRASNFSNSKPFEEINVNVNTNENNLNKRYNNYNNIGNRSYFNNQRQFNNNIPNIPNISNIPNIMTNFNTQQSQQNPLIINMINPQISTTNIIKKVIIQQQEISKPIEPILPPKEEFLPPLPAEMPPEPINENDKIEPGQILSDEDLDTNIRKEKRERRHSKSPNRTKYTNKKRERSRSRSKDEKYYYSDRKKLDTYDRRYNSLKDNKDRFFYKNRDNYYRSNSKSSDSGNDGNCYNTFLDKKKMTSNVNDFSHDDRYSHNSRKYSRNLNQGNKYDDKRDKNNKYK